MRALNRQGRGEVLTEKGRRKEGWQTTMERDGMTDRAIKGEREKSHSGQRTSFDARLPMYTTRVSIH